MSLLQEQGKCYEAIVVGAGIQGSATAYYLTNKLLVKDVLLLEQFSATHSRGSSSGSSRITRRAYAFPFYVKMMEEAFPMWSNLEKESHASLYLKTGILVFGSRDDRRVKKYKDSLNANSISYRTLTGTEVNERYGEQLSLPDDFTCILEEDGGILFAPQAIKAYQRLFVSAGGELKEEHEVNEIVAGEVVSVRTNRGSFSTRRLVLTAGPWTNKLLQPTGLHLPVKVLRPESLYWKVENPDLFSCDNFHTFIAYVTMESGLYTYFYGLPIKEYPGLVKICHHSGPGTDPDSRDSSHAFSSCQLTSKFVSTYFKGVEATPSIVEPCLYSESPDGHPIIDRHPRHPNIIIGTGFSGHGFKLSPVVGKVLSELAMGLDPSYDLSPFRISRFSIKLQAKY